MAKIKFYFYFFSSLLESVKQKGVGGGESPTFDTSFPII